MLGGAFSPSLTGASNDTSELILERAAPPVEHGGRGRGVVRRPAGEPLPADKERIGAILEIGTLELIQNPSFGLKALLSWVPLNYFKLKTRSQSET